MNDTADKPAATATEIDRRRYPGVRSFQEPDTPRFFGRHRATEELLLRVLSVRLLLQFAPSGAGKTSLLNAGLCPQLRPHGYLPCNVRLNQPQEGLLEAVARSLRDAAQTIGLKDPVIPENPGSLWDLLAGTQLWSAELLLLIPVLIFDQFEEVFTLRDETFRKHFAQEIGELTRGRRAKTSPEDGVETAPDVKFIISLREEYLGSLEEMTAAIPDLFRERLRLVPLTAEEAREAIVEPARLDGSWWSPKFEFDPDCLDSLIDFIDGTSPRIRVVEAPTLQLVCQRAEEIAVARAADTVSRPLVLDDFGGTGGLERLVHSYYTSVLNKLDSSTRKKAVALFERGLLDPSGKRLMLEQDEIRRHYGVDETTLNTLVENRLLRREPRNESVFYEITHDRLTDVIARHRSIRLPPLVRHTLIAGAVVILVLAVALVLVVESRRQAVEAQRETTQALDLLFGDELALRLREAGLSDTLDQVLQKAPPASDPLSHARALRRQGELALERETLQKANAKFVEADAVIDAAVQNGQPSTELTLEHAQVLKGLGDVLLSKGLVSQASSRYDDAVNILITLQNNKEDPMRQLDLIEIQLASGSTWLRLGDFDRADSVYADAVRKGLEVLTTAYAQLPDQGGDASFLLGRAMQVYADAVGSRARLWRSLSDLRSARALAAESMRLRPLSALARHDLGSASALYGASSNSTTEDMQRAQRMLEESQTQYSDLVQFDPRNRLIYRNWAAVQLVPADNVATCAENTTCAKSLRPDRLRSAESDALDATARFEELSNQDPEDRSYRDDVVWGKQTQARLRNARGNWSDALVLLEEALTITRSNLADARDLDNRWTVIDLLLIKARVLTGSPYREQALGMIDEAMGIVSQLPDGKSHRFDQMEVLRTKADILDKIDRKADAAAARAEADGLERPGDNVRGDTWKKALALNKEGNAFTERARAASGPERVRNYQLAEEQYRGAIAQNPGNPIIWNNLRSACASAASTMDDDNAAAADSQNTTAAKVESELRCALESAWMAWVLSDGSEDPHALSDRLNKLIQDRRGLAMFLRNDKTRVPEALLLARQNVREVKALVRSDSSADALFLLADSYYGLGLMSEAGLTDGWDEEMRAAIMTGEQLRDQEPKSSAHPLWNGRVGLAMADELESHQRSGVAREREVALQACQDALQLAKTPDDRKSAQSCIDDARKK